METLKNGTDLQKANIFEQEVSKWVKGSNSMFIANDSEKIFAMECLNIEMLTKTATTGQVVTVFFLKGLLGEIIGLRSFVNNNRDERSIPRNAYEKIYSQFSN